MAAGRFLATTISESDQLSSDSVSLAAALLFSWCVPHLDVEGRMTGNPALLKSKVVPLRKDIPEASVETLLSELVRAGLVVWYVVQGRQFLHFPGFPRSQRGLRKDKEAPSRIPPPDSRGTELVRTNSGPTPVEGKGSEVEGKVREERVLTHTADAERKDHGSDHKSPHGALMPLVRRCLYVPDGKPPANWSDRQDGSILKELLKSYRARDIEVAIEGLRLLAEHPGVFGDEVSWLRPGEKITLKALYNSRSGVLPMFERARQAYWKHANARPARVKDAPRAPQHISQVIGGVK